MPWTYIFISPINPIDFVVIWSTILKLYGVGLGFGSPNLNLNYFVIILTPKPPSSSTSSIVFFVIYTWITTIWLSITIIIVFTLVLKNQLVSMWLLYLHSKFSLVITSAKNISLALLEILFVSNSQCWWIESMMVMLGPRSSQ